MELEFTLLGNPLYIQQPQELIGWMGWLILLGSVIMLLVRWRKLNKRWVRLHWGIFIALLVLLVLTNLFFVIRLPSGIALTAQVLPPETKVPTILPFAALSWVLAAGLLGVFPAAALGLLSGTVFALLDTHNPFTALEFALLAIILSAAFHQRYRTWVFRLLRHPFFSTILFALIYPVLFILDTSLVPLAIVLVVGLMAGYWIVAGKAASNMLNDRLKSTAKMAANGIPSFLEMGQNLIQILAKDSTWTKGTLSEKNILLGDNLRTIPYFSEFYLLDAKGQAVTGYPLDDFYDAAPSSEEYMGISLALNGLPIQMYTLPPNLGGLAARLSFMAAVYDPSGARTGVLVGRTDLATNPFSESIIISLNSLSSTRGEGILIDDSGTILYSSSSDWVMGKYTSQTALQGISFDDLAPDGTRSMMYYQPVWGRPWAVIVSVPAQEAQQLALQIAAPLLIMIIILFLIAALVLRFSLRTVTASLQNLALETNRISSGQLDKALATNGNDEVGQLRHAFENMRSSLKARLDELNRLLQVSRGVASSLEFEESVKPVMEAALSTGASAVAGVFSPDALPEMKGGSTPVTRFGSGRGNEQFAYLEDQILPMTRQKERVTLNNLGRVRLLTFPPNAPRPEALLALPLHHEKMFYGAFWLAYDKPHQLVRGKT